MSSGCEQTDAQRAVKRARHAANKARDVAASRACRETLVREMFAIPVREYTYRCIGRPVNLLRAGYLTPLEELGLDQLREDGFEITVVTVDENRPQFAAAGGPGTASRSRAVLLLDRIPHVELVLDRFTAALRPGGLLLLRIRDGDCAAGLLDRRPGWVRRVLWDTLHPGQPGPFPAVYEPAASDHGIQAYMQRRGLVIAHRETASTPPADSGRAARAARAARRLISRLTRDRLTDAHDEVLYVIRKPEDRFARVV